MIMTRLRDCKRKRNEDPSDKLQMSQGLNRRCSEPSRLDNTKSSSSSALPSDDYDSSTSSDNDHQSKKTREHETLTEAELINICRQMEQENDMLRRLLETKKEECAMKEKEYEKKCIELSIMKRSINELNADCLMEIFEYIDDVDLSAVCQHWKNTIFNNPPRSSTKAQIIFDSIDLTTGHHNMKIIVTGRRSKTMKNQIIKPEEFFMLMRKYIPFPLVLTQTVSSHMVVKTLAMCPDWWLERVTEIVVELDHIKYECYNTLWRFPQLRSLSVNVVDSVANRLTNSSHPASTVTKVLMNTKSQSLAVFKVSNLQCIYSEADIVDVLIEKSLRSDKGLREVRMLTNRKSISPLPPRDIITLIEKAKFVKTSRDERIMIVCDQIGVPNRFLRWFNEGVRDGHLLNDNYIHRVNGTKTSGCISRIHEFQFDFRRSSFTVQLNCLYY